MDDELMKEWKTDYDRVNKISEKLYDEEHECFDAYEYACELEEIATKYLFLSRSMSASIPEQDGRKNYRLIYKQRYMGKVLQDMIIKNNKTIEEMNESVGALYSDPCVFKVWYEEM